MQFDCRNSSLLVRKPIVMDVEYLVMRKPLVMDVVYLLMRKTLVMYISLILKKHFNLLNAHWLDFP
jgi:hypothetical protein